MSEKPYHSKAFLLLGVAVCLMGLLAYMVVFADPPPIVTIPDPGGQP